MLTEPPCRLIFVGCDHDDRSVSTSGNTGGSSSRTNTASSSSTRTQDTSFSQSSSSSRSSLFGSNLAGNLTAANAQVERIAAYTLSVSNRGSEHLKNLVFSHGPLPSGFVFNTSQSSQGCRQVGLFVECTTDIDAGASQDFAINYTVPDSITCAVSSALQTVKNTVNGIAGATSSGVSIGVSCAMQTQERSGAFSSSSLSSTASAQVPMILSTSTDSGVGNNYDPYEQPSMPRTGAMDVMFSSTQEYVLQPVTSVSHQSSLIAVPWILGFIVSFSIFLIIAKRRIFV